MRRFLNWLTGIEALQSYIRIELYGVEDRLKELLIMPDDQQAERATFQSEMEERIAQRVADQLRSQSMRVVARSKKSAPTEEQVSE